MKIQNGDHVVIISGKDKGKTGTVLRVLHSTNRVVVSGVNMRTRHMRATPQRAGQKVTYEASIHASNVMLVDPKTKKRTRIATKIDDKGKKTRVAVRSGEALSRKKAAPKVAADDKKTTDDKKAPKKAAKKADKAEAPVAEAGMPPAKRPFWKRVVDFGGDEAEVKEPTHMQEDHSVPDQIERQSQRSHSRNG